MTTDAPMPAQRFLPLFSERRGSSASPPAIFIHGFGGDALGWLPLLAELPPDIPAVLIELPGHGRSPFATGFTLDTLARHVAATLENLEVSSGHLVGHSLGGAVAIALASRCGFQALSACLIAPAGLGPEINRDFVEGFVRADDVASLHPWLRQLVADDTLFDDNLAEFAMQQRQDETQRRHQQQMADHLFVGGAQSADLRADLDKIDAPCRLIWGREDRIIPWEHALAAPARIGVHFLSGIGHLPHLESPALVARILGETLRSA